MPVDILAPRAVSWCLSSVVYRSADLDHPLLEEVLAALRAAMARRDKAHMSLLAFNDHPATTLADVLDLLDDAIAMTERARTPPSSPHEFADCAGP